MHLLFPALCFANVIAAMNFRKKKFSNPFGFKAKLFQRKKSFKINKLLLVCVGVTLFVVIAILSIVSYPKPPLKSISSSRSALKSARSAQAAVYAAEAYHRAEQYWKKVLYEWHQENQRIFFRRDFRQLRNLAIKANSLAWLSKRQALQVQDSLKNVTKIELIIMQQKLAEFKKDFSQLPIEKAVREKYVRGEMLISESESAFLRGNYYQALSHLKAAGQLIGQSGQKMAAMLAAYFKSIPMWQQWKQEVIQWSQQNNEVAILVDKFEHSCQVYSEGKLTKQFAVELGPNWIGSKRCKGDNATPEGQYFITEKMNTGQSKYYQALVIDYPNQKDKEKFLAAKQRGELPENAQIGGSIEIHGEGGKGGNWTQGCIALKNADMEKLFSLVKVGTPVTIVGSANALRNSGNAARHSASK